MSYIQVEKVIPSSVERVFELLSDPTQYRGLLSPILGLELVSPKIQMKPGAEYEFRATHMGINQLLSLRVESMKPNQEIELHQSLGFFAHYRHTMKLTPHDTTSCRLGHFVDYDVQFGLFGKLYDDLYLRGHLKEALEHASKRVAQKLKATVTS